jgi:hypothetical protein
VGLGLNGECGIDRGQRGKRRLKVRDWAMAAAAATSCASWAGRAVSCSAATGPEPSRSNREPNGFTSETGCKTRRTRPQGFRLGSAASRRRNA